jgi:hypothetical protein
VGCNATRTRSSLQLALRRSGTGQVLATSGCWMLPPPQMRRGRFRVLANGCSKGIVVATALSCRRTRGAPWSCCAESPSSASQARFSLSPTATPMGPEHDGTWRRPLAATDKPFEGVSPRPRSISRRSTATKAIVRRSATGCVGQARLGIQLPRWLSRKWTLSVRERAPLQERGSISDGRHTHPTSWTEAKPRKSWDMSPGLAVGDGRSPSWVEDRGGEARRGLMRRQAVRARSSARIRADRRPIGSARRSSLLVLIATSLA